MTNKQAVQIRGKSSSMKRYITILLVSLSLAFSLPVAASTGDTSVAMTVPDAVQQDQKSAQNFNPPSTVSLGAVSTVKAPAILAQQEPKNLTDSTPADAGYNLHDYNTNEVASKAVERNIGLFSNTIRDKFSLWLSRSGKYIEMMKDILRRKDIPENIVFLSLIESGFNPNAYSVARAAGPWQFIASTAKRYGLEINWWKDERRDPVKSTDAAASYLKDLYGMFGSWNLAMAAYNAGEGRILKAMKRSNADDYWALLGTSHIKPETKDYVPKFIAAGLIATNPGDFGFDEIEYHTPLSFDEVELNAPVDLSVAAECAGTTIEEIKRLNPELRRWCTPPDVSSYTLKIPEGTKEQFSKALAAISQNERFTIERYVVNKGETFSRIAKKTGVPLPVILSLNSLEKIMPLKPGSVVYLPPKGLYSLDHEDRSLIKKASYRPDHRNKPMVKKATNRKALSKKSVGKVTATKRVKTKSRKA